MNIQDLKIDHEFENIIPALADVEFKQLEENILSDGEVFNPIFTWNGFIIDGHHRYKILQKHPEIKYRIVERKFDNWHKALAWICNNQLGRRNLTEKDKDYLIGKRYTAEKNSESFRGNQYTTESQSGCGTTCHNQNMRTRERLAREYGVCPRHVSNAEAFAKGVDAAEEVLPGIKSEILSEKINPSKEQVAAIAKAPKEEQLKMTEALRTAEEERRKELQRKREERQAKRERMANIDRLSAEHANINRPPVSIESHLESFTWTAERFLGTCDSFFEDAPELITNEKYRDGVMVTGEKFIQYFTKIKENRYEPYSV